MTRKIAILLILLASIACAPRPFIYEGKYVNMRVRQEPIDEFKVGEAFVVVAFEYKQKAISDYCYQFPVIAGGAQVGNINFAYFDFGGFSQCYCLFDYLEASDNLRIFKRFPERPAYEVLKADVISIVNDETAPQVEVANFSRYIDEAIMEIRLQRAFFYEDDAYLLALPGMSLFEKVEFAVFFLDLMDTVEQENTEE